MLLLTLFSLSFLQVLLAIDSNCPKFLWNGCVEKKGGHHIKWEDVCRSNGECGLGIRNLQIFNDALVINQLWDMMKDGNSLWNLWVKQYWTRGPEWWEVDNTTNSYWILRRLAYYRILSEKCVNRESGQLK
ncbi:hypothetical protein QQ045_020612 [Rhodiola kirilowii]